jgi:hypothetical protein
MSEIRIETFQHHDGPLEDYLALPRRVEGLSAEQATAEAAGTRALLDSYNSFYCFGSSCKRLAYRAGAPVGRLTAFRNRMLHGEQARCGLVGLFAGEDDADAARALIGGAADWLREQGLETVRGPMAGDIWHRWRFMTRGFATAPFPGEPAIGLLPRLFTAAASPCASTDQAITDMPAQLERFSKAMLSRQRGSRFAT